MTSITEESASAAEPVGINGLPQANMIPSVHSKPTKSRHRASVACSACRDRRTRCIVPAGEAECTQCRSAGYQCVITYDDERRKPNSKAYMQSLTDRIAILENMLKEKGEEPPPTQYPEQPTTNPAAAPKEGFQAQGASNSSQGESSAVQESSPECNEPEAANSGAADAFTPPSMTGTESMVKRLLSTRGHLSFDQLSGRLRYFGPTTNCHIYSELSPHLEEANRQMLEQQRRTEKIIRTLSPDTHDYLMQLFWQHYNSVLHVVHEAAFHEDKDNGRNQFYSGFLHICILAMGYRFADKMRPDMMKIALPARESTLHREAKYMLDCELERPGGIPSIAALLLLGDLECGVGRDNLGWLYAGMANRLCFDIGLHLDNRNSGMSQREIEIGRMTLWACVVYDKYWALFLGRPTSLKSADLEIYNLSQQFERLGACQPAGPAKSLETQIYEALLDLMELAGKITEMISSSKENAAVDHHAYLRMAALDRELGSWYTRLAKPLQWTPENISSAPFSFFLLHQQYHSTLILLHRPFARYEDSKSDSDSEESGDNNDSSRPDHHFSALSRTVCTKHAVRVARIFWQHRQRFDSRIIFVTGMQHAGTAAIALVAALAYIKDPSSRASNMQYLECLAAALQDMTQTYQPAERMSAVLQAVMAELRETLPPSARRQPRSLVPSRRLSSNDNEVENKSITFKKRQIIHPHSTRTTSQSFSQQTQARPQPETIRSSSFTVADATLPDYGSDTAIPDLPSSLDGFVVITPNAENISLNGHWPNLGSADASSLDYPMSTATTSRSSNPQFSQNSTRSNFRSTWMGAETPTFSPHPQTSHASEFRPQSLLSPIDDRMEDAAGSNVDFMRLLNSADWHRGNGFGGGDLDGFPTPQPMPAPAPAKRTSTSSLGYNSNDAYAGTIGGLNDIWNEMLSSSKSG